MKLTSILILIVLTISSCSQKNSNDSLEITVYESYDLVELAPKLIEANKLIRKYQLDSISNTGIELLDQINSEAKKSDKIIGNSLEDFPLLGIMLLNVSLKNVVESTALIATTNDSLKVSHYLSKVDSLFPSDLEWKITGKVGDNAKCIHAIKNGGFSFNLSMQDIDSVRVLGINSNGMGKLIENVLELNSLSRYWVEIKLKKELSSTLSTSVLTIFYKSTRYEYSGSIVNFKTNPDQYILVGEMDKVDFHIIESSLEDKIKFR